MASISQAKFFVAAILCIASGSAGSENLMLASTTSTEQSGLFAYLLPLFKQAGGLDMKVRAVGTGQALDLARHGDSDALLIQNQAGPRASRAAAIGSAAAARDALNMATASRAYVLSNRDT